VNDQSRNADRKGQARSLEEQGRPAWFNAFELLLWLLAGAVAFLPFAFDTSPWDAVTLRVPGNQGNWWHFLAGAPFFLAFPMIWLRLRAFFSTQPSTRIGRRLVWSIVSLSIAGTIAVEMPFLLHLAGTSEWQRLSVLSLGFGIVVAGSAILFLRRGRASLVLKPHISAMRRCVSLFTATPPEARRQDRDGWYRSSSSGRFFLS
jgi:hypothetical protein